MNSPLLLVLTAMAPLGAEGRVECEETSTCEARVRQGSVCAADGHCSNPFQGGCLRSFLGEEAFPRKRVCNSDDPDDAAERGLCDEPSFDYDEIRISNQNWDGPMISSWIMQILLSELLQVPTTIETYSPDLHYTFYDPRGRGDYSAATYPYDALRKAKEVGDCRLVRGDAGGYVPCAHVLPMVNKVGQADNIQELKDDDIIGQPRDGGNVDQYRWWMPKKFAKQDPTLLSYMGLGGANEPGGDSVRLKLAEAFKRPTTWGDYCAVVSSNNCSTNDGVAARAPGVEEAGAYFVDGLYTGHFRATDKNDCAANPESCTGHITHVPCSWGNYATAQAYHLGIPVSSDGDLEHNDGYGYSSLLEIYAAANATDSNVLMYWWEPDSLIELYRGTDFELLPILLPPTTKECMQNRPSQEQRCSANLTEQAGDPVGSCDTGPVSNVIMMTLEQCEQSEYASCSPAYSTLQSYQLNNLDLQQIYQYRHKDPNNDGREAVCRWFVENLQTIQTTIVPKTYPRQRQNEEFYQPWTYFTLFLGSLSVVSVMLCACAAKFYKKTKVMVYAQVDFLLLILSGLFLVAMGAVLSSIAPTKVLCILRSWLVAVGYSLELIPLAVKVAAINRLFHQSKRCRRVEVKKSSLYKGVGCCIVAVCIYLATWTGVDPPTPRSKMTLTSESEDENYVVEVSNFCESSNGAWQIATSVYLIVLLIMAAAVATQNRDIRQEFNESRYLCLLIYSHVVFVLLRLLTVLNKERFAKGSTYSGIVSLLLSLDILITIGIYFMPKVMAAWRANGAAYRESTQMASGSFQQTSASSSLASRSSQGTRPPSSQHPSVPKRRESLTKADPNSFVWTMSQRLSFAQGTDDQGDGYGDANGTGFADQTSTGGGASSTNQQGDGQSNYDEFMASITSGLEDLSTSGDVSPDPALQDDNPAEKLVNEEVRDGATASGLERRVLWSINHGRGDN